MRLHITNFNPYLFFPVALWSLSSQIQIRHRSSRDKEYFNSVEVGDVDVRPYSMAFFPLPDNAGTECVLTEYSTLAHFNFGLATRCV